MTSPVTLKKYPSYEESEETQNWASGSVESDWKVVRSYPRISGENGCCVK